MKKFTLFLAALMVSMVSFADAVTMKGIVKRALQLGEGVVVLTHEDDGTPHIYNIVGETITEVSQEGVVARDPDNAGDYLSVSDIAVTTDGKLVACNYIMCQNGNTNVDSGYKRGSLRFYVWNELNGNPSLWFSSQMSSNWFRSKQGYTMAVKGTSTNAEIFTTGFHGQNGKARFSIYKVIDGTFVEPPVNSNDYCQYHNGPSDIYGVDATTILGAKYELNAANVDGKWIIDGDLVEAYELNVPKTNGTITNGASLSQNLGKKYNGASYITFELKDLMVAPYADAEGKLAGIKVIDITAGFASAQVIKEANLDVPITATAAATAVAIAENVLTVTLVADAEVHTLTVELDTKVETHTITATANIAERGHVEGLENEGVYEAGAEVTLRAVANEGYEFVDWSNGSTDNPLTLIVKKDETLVANFRPILPSSITLNALPAQDYSATIVGTLKRALQNGENTIVLTHEADGTPHIYNIAHATKTVTEISQEGVVALDPDNAGDLLTISDIALTDDGKLVACNKVVCQSDDSRVDAGYKRGTTRVYKWDDLAGNPSVWLTSQHSSAWYKSIQGHTMALKGSSTNATIMITGVTAAGTTFRYTLFTVTNGSHTASRFPRGANQTTDLLGQNYELNASPLGTANFILDGGLVEPFEIIYPSTDTEVTVNGQITNNTLGKKYNGASYFSTYCNHHLMVAPYANEEGYLAGVKVLDIEGGLTAATELTTDTDLATAENATAAAATATVDAEGNLTIHLFADAKVYTFTQKEQTDGPTTAVDNTVVAPQVEKIVCNGQVLIIRDGKTFNMMGQEVK